MADTPEDDDKPKESEALREVKQQRAATTNGKWVAGAVATGIGSAALVAALLYANRNKDKKGGA